jgi:peptidoglycan/LPS O-acetylase OafA/YrhL
VRSYELHLFIFKFQAPCYYLYHRTLSKRHDKCLASKHGLVQLNRKSTWCGKTILSGSVMAIFHIPTSSGDGLSIPRQILLTILPTYLQQRVTGKDEVVRRLHNTSALDGLRGIAALFVFYFHVGFAYQAFVEFGYGQSEENMRVIQLPFLSLFFRGHSMVAVFFVVGGYVLSIKPLTLIHSHRPGEAHGVLVSSVFRRGIRLYLPAIVVTFITMISIYAGLWEYPRRFITDDKKYIYYADLHPARFPTFYEQFWNWIYSAARLTDIFNYYNRDGFMMPYYNQYDPHLWTVPFEYRSSLIVSMVILAFSKCTNFARLFLVYSVIVFCILWDRWELVCFLSGLFICDIDITMRSCGYENSTASESVSSDDEYEEKLPLCREPFALPAHYNRLNQTFKRARFILHTPLHSHSQKRWMILFAVGLYLLSTPNLQIENTPGYGWLFTNLTPHTYTDSKRFLQSVGALFVTWSVANSKLLQIPFNSNFAQYLGHISYSLYVVHGPLIHIVGFSVTPWIWINVTGMEGSWYWLGLSMGTAVLGVSVAVAADLFHRLVDVRAVKLGRWFEDVCFVRE